MSEPTGGFVECSVELLRAAEQALTRASIAALTVKPSLDKPYSDDPRWTPWSRWMDRPAHEALDVAMKLRDVLRQQAGRQEAADDEINARQMRSDMGHHGGTYGPA